MTNELRVMTSGAFTAAHFKLIAEVEELTSKKIITVTTSIGTGESSIPNRLRRGEVADVVIVADTLLKEFIKEQWVLDEGFQVVASSVIGIAVREGAPKPDLSSVESFKQFLLAAQSVAYSASVSGQYLLNEIYPRLGIESQMLPKSRLITGGERTGTIVARGEAEVCCQQISEMLPIEGIAHITTLPEALQKKSFFAAGIGSHCTDKRAALQMIQFLTSAQAAPTIRQTGLEPI
jgi:molybdate transport system substrate-binding protein